jgi:predicted protein tyrosine phosphatase
MDSRGYDPNVARESPWHRDYVGPMSNRCLVKNTKHGKKFRRRFRMPIKSDQLLMKDIRDNDCFPEYEKVNALSQVNVCLVYQFIYVYKYMYISMYILVCTCVYIDIYL